MTNANGHSGVRTILTRAVRWGWVTIAALLLVLHTLWGLEAPLPFVGILLLSFPAGLLAGPITNFISDFPVRIEGMPFPPPWWIYGLLALVLGYLQWFVLLPRVAGKLMTRHQEGRLDDRA